MVHFLEGNNVEEICLSEITDVEVPSALWKKVRMTKLSDEKCKESISAFEQDSKNFIWIGLNEDIRKNSKRLLARYFEDGLRSLDAIQLASMLEARNRFGAENPACGTAYERLNKVLKKEGLHAIS